MIETKTTLQDFTSQTKYMCFRSQVRREYRVAPITLKANDIISIFYAQRPKTVIAR